MSKSNHIVYVLTNEAMPKYCKLGQTKDLVQRIKTLDNTSLPLPFECFYAARVNDAKFVEKQLHDAFDDHRIRSNREFFEIEPERLAAALKIAEIEDVTPQENVVETKEDEIAIAKAKSRRPVFNFSMAQIPVGATLTFSKDATVVCEVADKRNVYFEGHRTSLSVAASIALKKFDIHWKAVQGPAFWEFEGETLTERRERILNDE